MNVKMLQYEMLKGDVENIPLHTMATMVQTANGLMNLEKSQLEIDILRAEQVKAEKGGGEAKLPTFSDIQDLQEKLAGVSFAAMRSLDGAFDRTTSVKGFELDAEGFIMDRGYRRGELAPTAKGQSIDNSTFMSFGDIQALLATWWDKTAGPREKMSIPQISLEAMGTRAGAEAVLTAYENYVGYRITSLDWQRIGDDPDEPISVHKDREGFLTIIQEAHEQQAFYIKALNKAGRDPFDSFGLSSGESVPVTAAPASRIREAEGDPVTSLNNLVGELGLSIKRANAGYDQELAIIEAERKKYISGNSGGQ